MIRIRSHRSFVRRFRIGPLLAVLGTLVAPAAVRAADAPVPVAAEPWMETWKSIHFGTQWFLTYGFGEQGGVPSNGAGITRGYTTLKIKPVAWFEPRITLDTSQNDAGDWAVRLKYLYGKFILPVETAWFSEPNLEVGLVHTPWFDYEEHINRYRMQGTMFVERAGLLNSADLGLTAGVLLGRKLPADTSKAMADKYPGTFGSLALGAYNGGGYHALEKNQNKVFMARASLRPLGTLWPNLQLSYFFVWGKGNTAAEPDWWLHNGMASVQHEFFALTGQFFAARGNQKGSFVEEDGQAQDLLGASGFLEVKLPWIRSSLVGRYDWVRRDAAGSDVSSNRLIAGFAFHLLKGCDLLLDYDRLSSSAADTPADWRLALTLQVGVP